MKTHYGRFGGQYVAETLMAPLAELESALNRIQDENKYYSEQLSAK